MADLHMPNGWAIFWILVFATLAIILAPRTIPMLRGLPVVGGVIGTM